MLRAHKMIYVIEENVFTFTKCLRDSLKDLDVMDVCLLIALEGEFK